MLLFFVFYANYYCQRRQFRTILENLKYEKPHGQ